MGNSGSVHHMQSGIKELHSYYQVQTDADGPDDLSFLNEEPKSFHKTEACITRSSRIPSSTRNFDHIRPTDVTTKNSQVKVLPNLTENLRLRSTTNGAILQSGGTISGRKESTFPQPMPLERSRTFITENSTEPHNEINASRLMTRRSQTQLNIDLRKDRTNSSMIRSQLQDNRPQYKSFTSNLDLKLSNSGLDTPPNSSTCNSSDNYQRLSKVKLKNKKRKAPPVPPTQVIGKNHDAVCPTTDLIHSKELERKQRLFKTKSQTIFQTSTTTIGSFARQQPIKPKVSAIPSPQLGHLRSSFRSKINLTTTTQTNYRREKSFDATLLSSRNTENGQHQRKSLQLSTMPIDFKTKRSEFKIELEAATKRRISSMNDDFEIKTREPSTRQREPNNDKLKPIKQQAPPRTSKPESQSKIPQLKKTFYFGMESSKRKPLDSSQKITTNTTAYEQLKSEDKSYKDNNTQSIKDEKPFYSLNQKYSSETNDNGIQVNVRPTLPRRQLEIPRFSPVAAWRTLSEEYRKQSSLEPTGSPLSSSSLAVEATNAYLIEDRIYRTYREPCPFYPDNKSGDSGISGDDAYLQEKPIQPRNVQNDCDDLMGFGNLERYSADDRIQPAKVVGPFLTPWTPQQDLEEEDTSSDGDIQIKLADSQSPISAHVFSLSLPRETQLSVYGEKNKPDFRSLQKLKRSVSGDLSGSAGECPNSSDTNLFGNICVDSNYRSDNWVLSKTGTSHKKEQSVACSKQLDMSTLKTSYFDLSPSIQPMSLGCLATGKHVMYLPNSRPITKEPKLSDVTSVNKRDDPIGSISNNVRTQSKCFSFQSSVRLIERRRLAEKLSKDAEQKEAMRKSELEAMRRVEEEFQRKRAYEKASIRHQLRLYSMDDDNFTSLPTTDYSQNCNEFRAEPDGAVSSTSVSPISRTNEDGAYLTRNRSVGSNNKLGNGNDISMIFA